MTIVRARMLGFRLPLRAPLATAHGTLRERAGLLLELSDESGRRGYGEAAPLEGFGLESLADAQRGADAIGRALEGVDASALASALECVRAAAPDAPAARAAADCALHDLAARRRGVSVADLLCRGAVPRTQVAISALVPDADPAAAAQRARRLVAAGYTTLKLKIGAGPGLGLDRVAAVRAAVGPKLRVRLDANGAFAADDARRVLAECACFGPELVEQPIACCDPQSWARLRADSPVPIAIDESLRDETHATALLAARAADWLVLKPAVLGGLAPALRIAEQATRLGVGVLVTSFLDSALGRAAALQLAFAVPGPTAAAGLATGALLAGDLADLPDAPRRALPRRIGLGIAPRTAALQRARGGMRAA